MTIDVLWKETLFKAEDLSFLYVQLMFEHKNTDFMYVPWFVIFFFFLLYVPN